MPEKKEKKKVNQEIATNVLAEGGKFCLDLAKLIFGGVILTGLMRQDLDYTLLFLLGTVVVMLFASFGFYLLIKSKRQK